MLTNGHTKNQLVEFCRHYYHGNRNQLELVEEFERDYTSEDAIKWKQHQYDRELEYDLETLYAQQNVFGSNGHPNVVLTTRKIGLAYENFEKYSTALEYYEKALEMIQ
ncbi:unnamed protein product, partial [Rotaria sordida]